MDPNNIRLSRISHPRATVWAMALLIIVFLGFGLWAEATLPAATSSTMTLQEISPVGGWLADFAAVLR